MPVPAPVPVEAPVDVVAPPEEVAQPAVLADPAAPAPSGTDVDDVPLRNSTSARRPPVFALGTGAVTAKPVAPPVVEVAPPPVVSSSPAWDAVAEPPFDERVDARPSEDEGLGELDDPSDAMEAADAWLVQGAVGAVVAPASESTALAMPPTFEPIDDLPSFDDQRFKVGVAGISAAAVGLAVLAMLLHAFFG